MAKTFAVHVQAELTLQALNKGKLQECLVVKD
jgi:hypothetical protein